MSRLLVFLASLSGAACASFALLGIWYGDDRWGGTAILTLLIAAALVCGAGVAHDREAAR